MRPIKIRCQRWSAEIPGELIYLVLAAIIGAIVKGLPLLWHR